MSFQEFPENIRNGIVAIAIRNAAQRSSSSMDIHATANGLAGHAGAGLASSPVHLPSCGAALSGTHETKLYEEVRLRLPATTMYPCCCC